MKFFNGSAKLKEERGRVSVDMGRNVSSLGKIVKGARG